MPNLQQNFEIDRCPHCSVHKPLMNLLHSVVTHNHAKINRRLWYFYKCNTCGGVVTAAGKQEGAAAQEIYPAPRTVDSSIPERARQYLKQSIDSIHAPAGAVMLAASAVDAMLKDKNLKDGSLYRRIEKAVEDHLITPEMATWAHEVRLDANDQRHADDEATLPSEKDAQRVIDFTTALAQFLFVLPQMVQSGIAASND